MAAARRLSSQPGHRTIADNAPTNSRAKRNQQRCEEDPEEVSGHIQKRRKTTAAAQELYTVDFTDVFQDGSAHHKHTIIQYPPGSHQWYILRCDVHGLHFNQNPLCGAANHLRSTEHQGPKRHLDIDMSEWPARWSSVIQTMGLRVLNCDTTKAHKNNEAFSQALKAGYNPLRPDPNQWFAPRETSQILSRPRPVLWKEEVATDASRLVTRAEPKEHDREVIMHPLEGKPYRAYWRSGSRDQGWYALIVLPLGSFDAIGLHGSFLETDLAKSIPSCYERHDSTVFQWAEGYRDGERLVTKRKFPVMWIHDGQTFPLHKDLMMPTPAWYNWLPAPDLRPFSADCASDGNNLIRGYNSAVEYTKQVGRIKAASQRHTVRCGGSLTGVTGLWIAPDRLCAYADAS